MANNQKKLKAFVRYDGSGRVVASSLILRKNKPRVGRWYEIPEYLCCNGTSPSTTTTTTTGGGVTPTAFIRAYWLNTNDSCNTTQYGDLLFYSLATSLAPEIRIYTDAALTSPVATGLVIADGMFTKYVVGGGGLIYLYNCPPPTTTSTTTQGVNNDVFKQGSDNPSACASTNLIQLFWVGSIGNNTQVYTDQALTQPYFTMGRVASTTTNLVYASSNGFVFNAGSC